MIELERAIVGLLKQSPFYAYFLLGMKRETDSKMKKKIGLKIGKDSISLLYNKDADDDISLSLALRHIIHHLLLLHPMRKGSRDKEVWNIASDLVANDIMPATSTDENGKMIQLRGSAQPLPESTLYPTDKSGQHLLRLSKGLTADQYYEALKGVGDRSEMLFNGKKSVPEIDAHEWDGEFNPVLLSEIVKQITHEAVKSCGNVPAELKEVIKSNFEQSKVSWRELLSMVITNSLSANNKYTWKRAHKRFGEAFKGVKRVLKPKILIGVDTSGSIGEKEQKMLVNEVENIVHEVESEIIVAGYDTRIHTVKKLSNGDDLTIRNTNGGTDFQPLNDLADEESPDVIINLTDGCAPTPRSTKFTYLWAFTKNHQNHNYGDFIVLE